MSDEQPSELLATRRRKLEALREEGIDPFPHAYPGVRSIAEVKAPYEELPAGEETEDRVRVAGRLAARRGQGKAAFLDFVDRSGRMQLHARLDVLGEEPLERLLSLDLGDLIGADGTVFRTRRGELSLKLEGYELLAKSLRPPPEKHHGLTDVETRFRHRELDLIANEETREVFMTRAKIITAIRAWLDERDFIEVETPVLQPIYGGGIALPFTTHFNALDRDFYLRIAVELYLKRLIVGGLERVYEIGKNFRNEGLSFKHNPEFTMLEWYEAYADYEDVARHAEELVHFVATQVGQDRFKPPWARLTLGDAIAEHTGVDIYAQRSLEGLQQAMRERDLEVPDEDTWAQLVDHLLSKYVEPYAAGADLPHGLSRRALTVRQAPPLEGRAGRALGGLRRRHGDRERVHRAQRPGRPAPPLRGTARRRRGRRQGGAPLRRGLHPGARARDAADRRDRHRDRPAGYGADRPPHDPRGRAVPRDALGDALGRQASHVVHSPLVDCLMAVSSSPISFIHSGWRAEYVGDTTFPSPSDPSGTSSRPSARAQRT